MASAKGLFEEPLKIFTIDYNSFEQKPTDSGEKAARTLAAKSNGARNFAREKCSEKETFGEGADPRKGQSLIA